MCSSRAVRPPTWSTPSPGLPDWIPATDADARRVSQATGLSGRVLAMETDGDPAGLYRLEPPQMAPLFVRLVGPERTADVERAEAIATWLAARGVPVSAPAAGFPRRLPDGGTVTASAFLDGDRLPAAPEAMDRLGRALARLHAALAEHPEQAAWAEATERRLTTLVETRSDLAAGRIEAGPEPARLAALAADATLDFRRADAPRRPLHGDLNPGNVLAVDGAPVFLDFEDAPHSVLPPVFELALALQRFVLAPLADEDAARGAGQALLTGYVAGGATAELRDLPGALRALSLRSLCLLAAAERLGNEVPEAEWRKFLDLEARAAARAATVAAIADDGGPGA